MTEWHVVAAQIRAFDDGKIIIKSMRKTIRQPVAGIRKAIRAEALATMPKRGGLNKWVAAARVNATVQINSRRVRLTLKGGRNSAGGRSDIQAIDRGRVRAPSWGRKGRGAWHTQGVAPGFFRGTAEQQADQVGAAVEAGIDIALNALRG